jgi:uncharacterized membrane protein YbaN (DUF454 family)
MSLRKALLSTAGAIALVLGVVGVVLPVLPTTPFVLLAATCFAASSPKALHWLQKNRLFGPYIDNYRDGIGITRARKAWTITTLWIGLTVSAVMMQATWFYFFAAVVAISVTAHLLTIRTRLPNAAQPLPEASS